MRRWFCFLLSVFLVLSLAGCSFLPFEQKNTDTDNPPKHSSSRPSDKISVSGGPVSDTDSHSDATDELPPRDILKLPIGQLEDGEQKQLADYLFEKYIPCSYGIFSDAKDLSSPSVWSSVEALNRKVDGDESEASRTLENVLKKVKIYYPQTPFDPLKVRVYDQTTKTFAPSPADTAEYVMLSYEVKGNEITIHYENKPDPGDPDGERRQYATTLTNSATAGYFTFLSSVRSGAVG